MKKILLLIPVVFLCLTVCGMAQPEYWQKIYQTKYNRENYSFATCTADGENFYSAGSAFVPSGSNGTSGFYICKFNKYGDTLWSRIVGGYGTGQGANCITQSDDNGCVVSGDADTIQALKINSNGQIVWKKYYNAFLGSINTIINTIDGGYLLNGYINYNQGYVLKIDSLGFKMWDTTFSSDNERIYNSEIELIDGYLLSGYSYNLNDGYIGVVTKINKNGNFVWEKKYKVNNSGLLIYKLIRQNNSILIFGDYYNSSQNRIRQCFLKLNDFGNVLDSVFIQAQENFNDHFKDVVTMPQNKFGLLLNRTNPPTKDTTVSLLNLIDSNGIILNSKLFSNYGKMFLCAITNFTNKSLIVTGFLNYGGFPSSNFDRSFLARVDSNLNVSPLSNIFRAISFLVNNFTLSQNYPNPFNPSTKISYSLKKSSAIELKLFDINGRMIKIIESGFKPAGSYETNFSAEGLSSGVYFFSLYSEGILMDTKKAVIFK